MLELYEYERVCSLQGTFRRFDIAIAAGIERR